MLHNLWRQYMHMSRSHVQYFLEKQLHFQCTYSVVTTKHHYSFLQAANSNKAGKQGKEHAGYCRHSWDMVVNKSLQTHWKKITYKHDIGLLALKSYIAHAFTHLFSQSKTIHTHAHIHNLITDTDTFSHKIMHI